MPKPKNVENPSHFALKSYMLPIVCIGGLRLVDLRDWLGWVSHGDLSGAN